MKSRMILIAACVGVFALAQTDASAAPRCNEAPYGNCMRCTGWANMAAWVSQACYFAWNSQVRFPCSDSKCGMLKDKVFPDAGLKPRPRQ